MTSLDSSQSILNGNGLDPRARREALQVAHTALSNEARVRMALLARQSNTIEPVNRLPFELAADILLRSMTPWDHESVDRLQELSQVQTRWWHIIKLDPRFWTTIHVGDSDATKLKIRKAGCLPVEIVCSEMAAQARVEPFFTLMQPRRTWTRRIDYRGPVRSLQLSRVALHWEHLELGRLKSLVLADYEVVTIPIEQFATALRSCGQLETLELAYIETKTEPFHSPIRPISLPALQSLVIRNVDKPFILPLLSALHADNLSRFQLSDDHGAYGRDVLKGLLEAHSPPPSLASLLTNPNLKADRLELEVFAASTIIQGVFAHEDARLLISITDHDCPWVYDSICQLERMSLSHCGVPIHVSIDDPHDAVDMDDRPLDPTPFTAMTLLRLYCRPYLAALIVQHLLADDTEWSCPRLEEIDLGIGHPRDSGYDDRDWEQLALGLASLVGRRNNEEARSDGVARLGVVIEDRRLTKPDDILRCLSSSYE